MIEVPDFHIVEPCLFCDGNIIVHHCAVHGDGVSHSIPMCNTYDSLSGQQIMQMLVDRQHPETVEEKRKN